MSRLHVTTTGDITNSQQKAVVKGMSEHSDEGTKVGDVLQLFSSAFFILFYKDKLKPRKLLKGFDFPYTPASLHTLSKEIFPEK